MLVSARIKTTACALGACVAWTVPGQAEDASKQRCVHAYEDAQTSKRKGQLIEAEQELRFCSSAKCPEVMHGDCQRWLSEVEASIPTVVFRVETSSGSAVESATASIDGGDEVSLDGRALSLNPGRHRVTFSAKRQQSTTKLFDFSEGEKLRREVVVLAPTPRATPKQKLDEEPKGANSEPTPKGEQNSDSHLVLPLVLASSVAVLGGVGAAYFGLTARAEDRDLTSCFPNCSRDSVDRVRRDYLLTNVSLGVAGVGLAATAVLLVLELQAPKPSQAARLGLLAYRNQLNLSLSGNFW